MQNEAFTGTGIKDELKCGSGNSFDRQRTQIWLI
jgi:hypothetical protein